MTQRSGLVVLVLSCGFACTRGPSSAEPAGAALPTTPTIAPSAAPPAAAPSLAAPPSAGPLSPAVPSPDPALSASGSTATSPGGKVKNATPCSIEFEASKLAVLRNQGDHAFWILHDPYLQPSRLEVTQADGTVAPVFDTRATKKFDNTVRKSSFRRLEPGAELPLFQLEATERDSAYELRWGPYKIGPLPRGKYSATVIWESRETHYFDEEAQKKRALDGAFVGTVRSPSAAFELPLR